jgi:hypothetical protein
MKKILLCVAPFVMLCGCALDLQSIKDEIRIPFVSDQGAAQKRQSSHETQDGHSQSSQLGTDKQGQRSGR